MAAPDRLSIRMYHVGFGDCFLLTFHYSTVDRHLLIDFGTTRQSAGYMNSIARDIGSRCGGRLDAIVATHRHKDHLSGFATSSDPAKPASGDLITQLSPQLVSMTWTEDPQLESDATGPRSVRSNQRSQVAYLSALQSMQRLAEHAAMVAVQAKRQKRYAVARELADLSEINIANKSALTNLLNMAPGQDTEFLHYGKRTQLNAMFRGVRFHVLGPPTVEQSAKVRSQRSHDADEYWHLAKYWHLLEQSFLHDGDTTALFAKRYLFAKTYQAKIPAGARWLVDQMNDPAAYGLLQISRVMDNAINNTSVILLIELWGTKLLFPGDAQIESWDYVLHGPHGQRNRELLADVDVYKVGHHGSLNGTPKTLWSGFNKRKTLRPNDPLICLLSSRLHVHGKRQNGTEVPRSKLVTALEQDSDLLATPYDIDRRTKFKVLAYDDLEIEFT